MKVLEVTSREQMAEAIRQHAGTDCRIVWGTFSITFRELCEGEKNATQVWTRRSPNHPFRWEWAGSARGKAAPRSARRRVAFEDERDQAAAAWDKMPRKTWPKF